MNVSSKLCAYLTRLEKSLGPISVSEKADIITEIKSHVLEAVERDSTQTIESILASLGEPEQVASRYLLERGLKPQKPPKHPVLKWIVIGFLGTLSIFAMFTLIIIWKFKPLIKIDEEKGRVSILGGVIDIKAEVKEVKDDLRTTNEFTNLYKNKLYGEFSGVMKIDVKKTPQIDIGFKNGKFDFRKSNGSKFIWHCNKDLNTNNAINTEKGRVKVDIGTFSGVKCSLNIPNGVDLKLHGMNGYMNIIKPHYNLDIQVTNGKINLLPDATKNYKYITSVQNGKIDYFKSSKEKDAYRISVSMTNGLILNAKEED